MDVWSSTIPAVTLAELHIYGSDRLGMYLPNEPRDTAQLVNVVSFVRTLRKREYELKDHLGNVRVTISDLKLGNGTPIYNADIRSYTNHYAFGMVQPDRSWVAGGSYRYGFNGKESDNEIKGRGNSLDYGARMYDPRLGRWGSVDPKISKYPSYSPFNFSLNNPILLVDPDGEDPIITITNQQIGMAFIKLIGSDDREKPGSYNVIAVPLYKVVITDDQDAAFRIETFVTRDSWKIDKIDGNKATISNLAFEPLNPNQNTYKAEYIDVYPHENNTAAYALTQSDGNRTLPSEKRKNDKGELVNTAKDIVIHVGGFYMNEQDATYNNKPRIRAGGSLGCFGIVNILNSPSNPSDSETNRVVNGVREQSDKDSWFGYSDVTVIVEKRNNVERTREVVLP